MGLLSLIGKLFTKTNGTKGAGNDRTLCCVQCEKDFIFEAGEQAFYQEKGFQEPKRCPVCRKQHRFGGNSRSRRRR